MPKSTGQHWLGAPDAASYLGVGLRVVYKLIDQGHIPAYGRVIRIRREDVDAFLEQNRIQSGSIGHLWSGYQADKRQAPSRGRGSAGDEPPEPEQDSYDA